MTSEDAKSRSQRPEHLTVTTHDGEPAIKFASGNVLQLRTALRVEDDDRAFGRGIETATEVDADEFAWWVVYPEGDRDRPSVDIEPVLIHSEEVDDEF